MDLEALVIMRDAIEAKSAYIFSFYGLTEGRV